MAYSERIKDIGRIRDYLREFFVFGFRSREEFTQKSARSYDNEKRRVESWLGEYMQFRQTAEGKNVFLSIDSRAMNHNPLFKAWKTKSFTDRDITLHFLLMDILASPDAAMSLPEILEKLDGMTAGFRDPKTFDESTVRKKLKEYAEEGIIQAEKRGRTVAYRRTENSDLPDRALLDFFSETAPCGVVGSFLLDKSDDRDDAFTFKHHYVTGTMDSEILASLFDAMREKRNVTVETINRHKDRVRENHVVPLGIMISAQSGRQYLMAHVPRFRQITSFRLDSILSVKADEICEWYDDLKARFERMRSHIWGVSTHNESGENLEYVEFTVCWRDDETHIPERLEREKRGGSVERLDGNRCRFSVWVYDSRELIPWMRSFLCRITEFRFSNQVLEEQFAADIREMYALYGITGEEDEDA
ncbi:MAG: WYL domain-containing transcriptional regulator [Clostridia bacterium]|nr:WYL domain-containing transcriptional regulator [Clostridia bacterium]